MTDSRPRSAGVTAAATLALLGCGGAFFLWGYFFLAVLNAPPDEFGRHFYSVHPAAFLVIALVPSGLIALGIRTGIGLFQFRFMSLELQFQGGDSDNPNQISPVTTNA